MSEPAGKSYNPREVEARIRQKWIDAKAFLAPNAEEARSNGRPPFVMVIPPPNVTGALHLGHALNNTLQDILVRQHRMAGCNTLWLPGTDHAGIATQATVEKDILKTEKKNRYQLGATLDESREELVRRIWEWKEKFGGRIVEQLQLMGCSCDWGRLRFTLDEQCARAVRATFFNLFRDGLIYRGKRLVNWDTQLQTAVADDEVYHETVKGHLWFVRYPLTEPARGRAGSPDVTHLVVATTRPETMLGDTAVAVHPQDPRFAPLVGRKVRLPLTDREIPIIADGILVKREFGTDCVKVTPAHDPNDYQCALRNNLPMINMMTPDGRVETAGPYKGMKLEEARKKIVADLEAAGLIEKIEEYETDIGHSDRSQVPIQPYLSDQWFVKMGDLTAGEAARIQSPFLKQYIDRSRSEPRPSASGPSAPATIPGLAQMAIGAVLDGRVRFFPERYAKTYLDWLGEKRDWCISRQLWWGHRVPVWSFEIANPEHCREEAISQFDQFLSLTGIMNEVCIHEEPETEIWRVCVVSERAMQLMTALEQWCDRRVYDTKREPGQPYSRRPDGVLWSQMGVPIGTPEIAQGFNHVAAYFAQDPDVLDTWFSSALWPHSTLGWPAHGCGGPLPDGRGSDDSRRGRMPGAKASGSDLDYYYPTTTLSTAREIITLWVARMVMTGLYNLGQVPFRDVVIHSVIQDGQGRKMSKSLGNGVDPVDIIDAYGADALRYTLAELATETQDIRIPVRPMKLPDGRQVNTSERFEKGRNFCNKLWQVATGFVLRSLEGYSPRPRSLDTLALEDRWILSRLAACIADADAALAGYHFSDYAQTLYQFMWNDYCDWYVEMCKPRLRAADDSAAAARQVLAWCLDRLCRLLYPVTPFITEAIWEQLNAAAPWRGIGALIDAEPALVTAAWPAASANEREAEVEADVDILKVVIRAIRDIRTQVNSLRSGQPALRTLPRAVVRGGRRCCRLLETHEAFVRLLAGVDALEFGPDAPKPAGSMTHVHESAQVFVPVGDLVDLEAERKRLRAALEEKQDALQRERERLSNEAFVSRAAPDVVERARRRADELDEQARALRQHLADLG